MENLVLNSFAKINLSLDVLSKRNDGYHNIDTIMQKISLKDILTFEKIDRKTCIIESSNKELETDYRNICYKVYNYFLENYKINAGLKIFIEKHIPISAGLAGGSSNAACTIKAIDQLFNLKLNKSHMLEIASKIGSDVAFFLQDKNTLRAKGRGFCFSDLEDFKIGKVLIVNNGTKISSKDVYDKIKISKISKIDLSCEALKENKNLDRYFYNTMENVSFKIDKDIKRIKEDMLKNGAKVSLMSGSGPTVFGIFDDEQKLSNAYQHFKDEKYVFICNFGGIDG